jgi:hypothetical protein
VQHFILHASCHAFAVGISSHPKVFETTLRFLCLQPLSYSRLMLFISCILRQRFLQAVAAFAHHLAECAFCARFLLVFDADSCFLRSYHDGHVCLCFPLPLAFVCCCCNLCPTADHGANRRRVEVSFQGYLFCGCFPHFVISFS